MLKSGVGVSANEDSYVAGVEAAQAAANALAGGQAKFVIVFASVQFTQNDVLRGVHSVMQDALICGSSTSGEISTSGPLSKHSVVVMAIAGDDLKVAAGHADVAKEGAEKAGASAAQQVKDALDGGTRLMMMFPDILAGNGADTVRGVQSVMGQNFPVVGGASGDDFKFKQTYQYLGEEVLSGNVVCVGLSGDFSFGIGVKHGWLPIGLPKKVTKAEGATIHEIDGKPAIDLYRDYFGDEEAEKLRAETLAQLAVLYPIGLKHPEQDEYLIRDPLSVDEHGSITCAAEVPQGSEIQLMIGSRDDAIKVAKDAAQHAKDDLDGKEPQAIIIFNCIARNKLFGERSGDEITAIQQALGQNVPLAGFYTYGEQAPINGEVKNVKQCNTQFHNETVVILALG